MNIAKITNRVALGSVVLMIYWVFVFMSTNIFGLSVFRENITQFYGMSILGIFTILSGAIILNIMYNLTSIAESLTGIKSEVKQLNIKVISLSVFASFVLLFIALYLGDAATSEKKKQRLVSSAESLVKEQVDIIERISDYNFSKEYLTEVNSSIILLSKIDESFPKVTAIITDEILGKKVLLGFNGYPKGYLDKKSPTDFILSTSVEERQYLYSVFDGSVDSHLFSSHNGKYEIYFPVKTNKGIVVLHLSEFSRYGKS